MKLLLIQILTNFYGELELGLTELQSFLPCEYSLSELEEIYGTIAQNQALEYLATINTSEKESIEFITKVSVDEKKAIEETKLSNISQIEENKEFE